jgi:hypothetical protein
LVGTLEISRRGYFVPLQATGRNDKVG